ncbi:MAG TPA: S8 family serine peptidase [Steroidobacteraceae bacterium]|nr:S8 family serine peptidase [Steroidobacteraceae bacterium]
MTIPWLSTRSTSIWMLRMYALRIGLLLAAVATHGCLGRQVEESIPTVQFPMPSGSLQSALKDLALRRADESMLYLRVDSFPRDSIFATLPQTARPEFIPLQASRQIIIQLRPDITADDLRALFTAYNIEPVRVFHQIGVIVVQISDVPRLATQELVQEVGDLESLDLSRRIDQLASDSRVLSAVANSVLSASQSISEAGVNDVVLLPESPVEQQDWGIGDTHIDRVWPRLSGEIKIGVLDVGFANHSDLKMQQGLPAKFEKHHHGNHVSGILCAQHNGIGVRGVLKKCTVVYGATENILSRAGSPIDPRDTNAWAALYSEYIASVLDFIDANPEVKVINISLAYNWSHFLNRDPRTDPRLLDTIAGQGRIFYSILRLAANRDVAIVSAAGNDSASLTNPLEAIWASPFNFGARLLSSDQEWSNALIVEAHDKNGKRASFSNIGGDISCPGVDVVSTSSHSATSLARMSGTSMAAPYCAGALAALRKLLPKISLRMAINCIHRSARSNGSVPMLDLEFAVANCTRNEESVVAAQRAAKLRFLSEAQSRPKATATQTPIASLSQSPSASDACSYAQREEFRVADVADLGDGQGPEIVNSEARSVVRQYAAKLASSGCREPALIALRYGFDGNYRRRLDFALAFMNEIFKAKYAGGAVLVEYPQLGDFNDIQNFTDRVVILIGESRFHSRIINEVR